MKRRAFLRSAIGATVTLLAKSGCRMDAGVDREADLDAAADWNKRIGGAGVRWFHNFDSDEEVTKYTPPSYLSQVSRVPAGGVDGGGFLQCRPQDNGDGTYTYTNSAWRRPFSPDPYSVGGYSPGGPWAKGMYAHPDYLKIGDFPDAYDGSEFYLQLAVLVSKERALADFGGKILWVTAWPGFTPSREFVIGSGRSATSKAWRHGKLQGYTNFSASGWQLELPDPRNTSNVLEQPAGEWDYVYGNADGYEGSCNYLESGECWTWPWAAGVDEWVTFLIHVVPGHDATGIASTSYQDGPARDTLFEIFVAEDGRYRKVIGGLWNTIQDSENFPKGWNGFQASCYYNGANSSVLFWQGYDQMIFSTQWIPPPFWRGA